MLIPWFLVVVGDKESATPNTSMSGLEIGVDGFGRCRHSCSLNAANTWNAS